MTHLRQALATLALIGWGSTGSAAQSLTLWYHGAENPVEGRIVRQIIDDFNASQTEWSLALQPVPPGPYADAVAAAAKAGKLPDILDLDGAKMPAWVWSGYLQPLQIDEAALAGFLPGTLGTYQGKLYAVGLWDLATALVTRQSVLDSLHLRRPTLDQPWSADEFEAALQAAKASGQYRFALDLGMAWTGEWYSYGFLPFLQSFGGDLVGAPPHARAEGALNGAAAQAWGTWWQHLFAAGYAQAVQDPVDRDNGFKAGEFAFVWNGNWAAEAMVKAFPDTVFLPAPDFGHGAKIGTGSWQFAVSATSAHPRGASAFMAFAVQDKYQAAFAAEIGVIPASGSAVAKPASLQATFADLAARDGSPRPMTPVYDLASRVFEKLVTDLAAGADVSATLDSAAREIDTEIERNKGYPAP